MEGSLHGFLALLNLISDIKLQSLKLSLDFLGRQVHVRLDRVHVRMHILNLVGDLRSKLLPRLINSLLGLLELFVYGVEGFVVVGLALLVVFVAHVVLCELLLSLCEFIAAVTLVG